MCLKTNKNQVEKNESKFKGEIAGEQELLGELQDNSPCYLGMPCSYCELLGTDECPLK